MNLFFSAAEISDHDEKSHSMMRFITSLSDDQARTCIDHELKYAKRIHVLALLAAQVAATKPVTHTENQKAPASGQEGLGKTAHGQILNALQLARAHVRCPLEGSALYDLRTNLDSALSLLGER